MTNGEIITKYLKEKGDDPNYWLDLSSESGDNKFRADIGYLWTGPWSDSVDAALEGLVKELKRVGEIK
jgi:hypothetical protein